MLIELILIYFMIYSTLMPNIDDTDELLIQYGWILIFSPNIMNSDCTLISDKDVNEPIKVLKKYFNDNDNENGAKYIQKIDNFNSKYTEKSKEEIVISYYEKFKEQMDTNTDNCPYVENLDLFIKSKVEIIIPNNENDLNIVLTQWKISCLIKKDILSNFKNGFKLYETDIKKIRSTYAKNKYKILENEKEINNHFKDIITDDPYKIKSKMMHCYIKNLKNDSNLANEKLDIEVGNALQFKYSKDNDCNIVQNINKESLIQHIKDQKLSFTDTTDDAYKNAIEIYEGQYGMISNENIQLLSDDEIKNNIINKATCEVNVKSNEELESEVTKIVNAKFISIVNNKVSDKWKSICQNYKKITDYIFGINTLSTIKDYKIDKIILYKIIEIYISKKILNGIKNEVDLKDIISTIKKDSTISFYIKSSKLKEEIVDCEIKKLDTLSILSTEDKIIDAIKKIGLMYEFDNNCDINVPSNNNNSELLKLINDIQSTKNDGEYILQIFYWIYKNEKNKIFEEYIERMLVKYNYCEYKTNKNIIERIIKNHNSLYITLQWKYACHLSKIYNEFNLNEEIFIKQYFNIILQNYYSGTHEDKKTMVNKISKLPDIKLSVNDEFVKKLLILCVIEDIPTYKFLTNDKIKYEISKVLLEKYPTNSMCELEDIINPKEFIDANLSKHKLYNNLSENEKNNILLPYKYLYESVNSSMYITNKIIYNKLINNNDCKFKDVEFNYTFETLFNEIYNSYGNDIIFLPNVLHDFCYSSKIIDNYRLDKNNKLYDENKSKLLKIYHDIQKSAKVQGNTQNEKLQNIFKIMKENSDVKELLIKNKIYEGLILCEIQLKDRINQKYKIGLVTGISVFITIIICIIAAILFYLLGNKK